MQTVARKKRRGPRRHGQLILLGVLAALLAGALVIQHQLSQPAAPLEPPSASPIRTIFSYAPGDVTALTIRRSDEAPWTVVADAESGLFVLQGEDGFTLTADATAELREAAHAIVCEEVLSDDPADYADHLADFGLETPRYTAAISFADGRTVTLHVGDRTANSDSWYYAIAEGDDHLYALGKGVVDELFVSRESLWDVVQPTLHKARIDRITLLQGDGAVQAEWTLMGRITDSDALDRWQVTKPFVYPADATAMSSLLSNAANLRLGAYVGPATAENLTRCGFDTPRMTIQLHMAAGTTGVTGASGMYTTTDWPESTCTFVIGGQRSDMVDYILHEDVIYVSSHFTFAVFTDLDPRSTMNRYPVLTALGNLATLTVTEQGASTTYALSRTERVAPNNELLTDEDGSVLYDVTVTRDGEPFDYAAFEAAYARLITISTAGVLPQGAIVEPEPHTVYTFTDVDGTVHTVALHGYGVLHDAVAVDGHQAFYMDKLVFRLGLE